MVAEWQQRSQHKSQDRVQDKVHGQGKDESQGGVTMEGYNTRTHGKSTNGQGEKRGAMSDE